MQIVELTVAIIIISTAWRVETLQGMQNWTEVSDPLRSAPASYASDMREQRKMQNVRVFLVQSSNLLNLSGRHYGWHFICMQ